jgi:hypothetical protein
MVDGIYYEFNNNDVSAPTVAVTYMGENNAEYKNEYTGHVSIPSTVTYSGKTYRVDEIGEGAFRGCDKLASVTISESVRGIRDYAFYGCKRLASIILPENSQLASIGKSAFYNCGSLTTVTLIEGVKSIEDSAFHGCSKLTSINIPTSVTGIGKNAFSGCGSLSTIVVHKSWKKAFKEDKDKFFEGCSNLKKITYVKK